ncbi:hypothetical protein [Streptomyces sp. NPDC059278]|uniref:hypothetical protein n=1 Tax=Streptomyces sp. NPDC059278 TaxID=3346801 RepID=UPI003689F22A
MTPRSPWRDSSMNICFGEDLPPILRHHVHPKSHGVTRKWRPVTNRHGINKPSGGLWAAPALLPEGKWRPIPRRSAWTEWCAGEMPHWINGRYQTQLFPRRDAVFAVIDSARDARALYDAFPNENDPVAALLREEGMKLTLHGMMIDWAGVLDRQIAGIWLTERGMYETHMPDEDIVPSLYGWDAATVWFSHRDAFTPGKTWRSPQINPDPYDMGWDVNGDHTREDFGAMAREAKEAAEAMRAEMAETESDGEEPAA